MYSYRYATKAEIRPAKEELENLILRVQDEVRNKFTFQHRFVGSFKRNMVTYDEKGNRGFDFDVNIEVNDDEEKFNASEIKHILMVAFNKFAYLYGYDPCEDSTRVFTIKVKDKKNSKIIYGCDFAIVNNVGDGHQQYIRFNKSANPPYYSWAAQKRGFYEIEEKIMFCKNEGLWNDVRETYLDKKNCNMNDGKRSMAIFAETINQICQTNGYDRQGVQR